MSCWEWIQERMEGYVESGRNGVKAYRDKGLRENFFREGKCQSFCMGACRTLLHRELSTCPVLLSQLSWAQKMASAFFQMPASKPEAIPATMFSPRPTLNSGNPVSALRNYLDSDPFWPQASQPGSSPDISHQGHAIAFYLDAHFCPWPSQTVLKRAARRSCKTNSGHTSPQRRTF